MKKSFEFFLVLIIFYGVYAAFTKIAAMLFLDDPKEFLVIIISLIAAALLFVLYSSVVSGEAKKKMKNNIDKLESEIKNRDSIILEKDAAIEKAQSFKGDLIAEAEKSLLE